MDTESIDSDFSIIDAVSSDNETGDKALCPVVNSKSESLTDHLVQNKSSDNETADKIPSAVCPAVNNKSVSLTNHSVPNKTPSTMQIPLEFNPNRSKDYHVDSDSLSDEETDSDSDGVSSISSWNSLPEFLQHEESRLPRLFDKAISSQSAGTKTAVESLLERQVSKLLFPGLNEQATKFLENKQAVVPRKEAQDEEQKAHFRELEIQKLKSQLISAHVTCEKEKEKRCLLQKSMEEMKHSYMQVNTYMKQLNKQLLQEKRNVEKADRQVKQLHDLFQDARQNNIEENKRLKKEIKKLRKREAWLIQELPKKADDSSDTEISLQSSVSGAMSTASLNEVSSILEQKMEKIAKSFTDQVSQMQESIVKLLPEQKKENNSITDDVNLLEQFEETDQCNGISQPANVENERLLVEYYDEMRKPYLAPVSACVKNYTISPDLTDVSDLVLNLSLDQPKQNDLNENEDAASTQQSHASLCCPLCFYECDGDYSNIAEHFNTKHMDKKCPFCEYSVPWDQDEQLNCHAQAHLDEEDAKKKSGGWLFSSLSFD